MSINKDINRSRLTSLNISGFKSLADQNNPQKIDFDDIIIIIGQNGSGKSNLVSFFTMLNMISTNALQEYISTYGFANSLLHYGSKYTKTIIAELSFSNAVYDDTYNFSLSHASSDTLIFTEEKITWGRSNTKHKEDKNYGVGHTESKLASTAEKNRQEQIVYNILSSCRVYQFHDTSNESYIKRAGNIQDNRYLKSNAGNLAAYLYMLKNTAEYKNYYQKIVSHIRMVMPQFGDFDLYPQTMNQNFIMLNWHEKNNSEYLFGTHQISDGSLRFMALAALLLQPPDKLPKVIIIDEPELGLHPEAIAILSAMIKTASLHSQIIVATQSTRLVDEFDPENIRIAERNKNKNCSIFKKLNKEELDIWLEDYSLSELWEKNILGGYI